MTVDTIASLSVPTALTLAGWYFTFQKPIRPGYWQGDDLRYLLEIAVRTIAACVLTFLIWIAWMIWSLASKGGAL